MLEFPLYKKIQQAHIAHMRLHALAARSSLEPRGRLERRELEEEALRSPEITLPPGRSPTCATIA